MPVHELERLRHDRVAGVDTDRMLLVAVCTSRLSRSSSPTALVMYELSAPRMECAEELSVD
mgnify:CR=1 FL=1